MPLVLTRRLDESVMIGDDIEVTIHDIGGGQVKLRIAAPHEVHIFRSEIWRARRREQLEREVAGSSRRLARSGS